MRSLDAKRPRGLVGASSSSYGEVSKRLGQKTTFRSRSQCAACDCWFNPYPGQTDMFLCSDCAEVGVSNSTRLYV